MKRKNRDAGITVEWGTMEKHPLEDFEDQAEEHTPGLPEDVAILYSWANLQGAKYRDFSANRREHRAQMRQRAAEQLRLAELRAQADSEAAAKQADAEAAAAHAAADAAAAKLASSQAAKPANLGGHAWAEPKESTLPSEHPVQTPSRERAELAKNASLRAAAQQARRAAAERAAAARRAEAAALAESIALREHQEIMEAQASALRQAASYAEAGTYSLTAGKDDPDARIPGKLGDPYSSRWREEEDGRYEDRSAHLPVDDESSGYLQVEVALEEEEDAPFDDRVIELIRAERAPERGADLELPKERGLSAPQVAESARTKGDSKAEVVRRIPESDGVVDWTPKEDSEIGLAVEPVSLFEVATHAMSELFEAEPVSTVENSWDVADAGQAADPAPVPDLKSAASDSKAKRAAASAGWGSDVPGPAWLYPRQHPSGSHRSQSAAASAAEVTEPLELSKERIAARWFALRGVFVRQDVDRINDRPVSKAETKQVPIVAVFSVAGGTGKTSLVATLGRALSFLGERVLLSDTTSHGLLPFYFGASQLVSGVVRTFSPPAGSTDAPIHLVSYDAVREGDEAEGQAAIVEDLLENSQRANRVLLDLNMACSRMVGHLGQFKPMILVPLMPDMNSVISIHAVETLFSTTLDADGRPLQPVYLLNQFDASLPLHLDIREVLKQQLGERLLPFVIRRSPAVGEALAEGMTIVDYDPGSVVAEDYLRVANWLRSVSAPVAIGFRNQRWSEQ